MIGLVTDSFEITSVNDEVWTNLTGNRSRVTKSVVGIDMFRKKGLTPYLVYSQLRAIYWHGSRCHKPKTGSSFSMFEVFTAMLI